jgi:hypothetical protein
MRDLTKRVAKLEQVGPGGKTHVVVCRDGQDPEAMRQQYLRDYPEAAHGRVAYLHTHIPPRQPLPAEFGGNTE